MDKGTITARRQIAIYHLRTNPLNRKQGTGKLFNRGTGSYCALVLLGECFGYDVRNSDPDRYEINPVTGKIESDPVTKAIYGEMCDSLQVHSGKVYSWNDNGNSFAGVAALLEEFFKENPAHDSDTAEETD